jgi:hypothetical protein
MCMSGGRPASANQSRYLHCHRLASTLRNSSHSIPLSIVAIKSLRYNDVGQSALAAALIRTCTPSSLHGCTSRIHNLQLKKHRKEMMMMQRLQHLQHARGTHQECSRNRGPHWAVHATEISYFKSIEKSLWQAHK